MSPLFQSFPASGSSLMSWFFPSGGKYWSFTFSISSSNEYSGLISFRIDSFDLLAVQGTLKSLLQYHNSKASILQGSDFFMAQLSYSYITTGKTIALTRQIFVGKDLMSLLFHMLSCFVIIFCFLCFVCLFVLFCFSTSSKHLLILWLQSPSAVILEPKNIKSVTVSIVFPFICHEVMTVDAIIHPNSPTTQILHTAISESTAEWISKLSLYFHFIYSENILCWFSLGSNPFMSSHTSQRSQNLLQSSFPFTFSHFFVAYSLRPFHSNYASHASTSRPLQLLFPHTGSFPSRVFQWLFSVSLHPLSFTQISPS